MNTLEGLRCASAPESDRASGPSSSRPSSPARLLPVDNLHHHTGAACVDGTADGAGRHLEELAELPGPTSPKSGTCPLSPTRSLVFTKSRPRPWQPCQDRSSPSPGWQVRWVFLAEQRRQLLIAVVVQHVGLPARQRPARAPPSRPSPGRDCVALARRRRLRRIACFGSKRPLAK